MFCQRCGNEIKEGSRFCAKCGCSIPIDEKNSNKLSECKEKTSQKRKSGKMILIFFLLMIRALWKFGKIDKRLYKKIMLELLKRDILVSNYVQIYENNELGENLKGILAKLQLYENSDIKKYVDEIKSFL